MAWRLPGAPSRCVIVRPVACQNGRQALCLLKERCSLPNHIFWPPSTTSLWPVINRDSPASMSITASATSPACPRPTPQT